MTSGVDEASISGVEERRHLIDDMIDTEQFATARCTWKLACIVINIANIQKSADCWIYLPERVIK